MVGKTQFLMRDAMRKGHTGKMSLFILDEKSKFQGKFQLSQCSARRFYSYFDLKLRSQLNIVPILAVDFSIANIVEMDTGIPTCLHSRKPGYPNEYV